MKNGPLLPEISPIQFASYSLPSLRCELWIESHVVYWEVGSLLPGQLVIAFRIMHFECQIFDSSGKKVSFMVVTGALTGCKWGMHSIMPLLHDVHRSPWDSLWSCKDHRA